MLLLLFFFFFISACILFSYSSSSSSLPFSKLARMSSCWFRNLNNFVGFVPAAGCRNLGSRDNEERGVSLSLLDLPELPLECILERLPPAELCRMGSVCRDLRERCRDNHFWERHMKQKWGRVVGHLALREWRLHHRQDKEAITRTNTSSSRGSSSLWLWLWLWEIVFGVWPFIITFFFRSNSNSNSNLGHHRKTTTTEEEKDSIMAQYVALETGQFWFPAQVYNRENGHAGFFLSCYDAHISYDSKTDTFGARYSSHPSQYVTNRMVEDNISWTRIRPPTVDTPPYDLHISDCLQELKPGDHIEIQWRKSDEFAYGWWYGVVGHEEDSCDGNYENHCQCHCSETVTLEFKQYPPNSRWRRTRISRKYHRQQGNKETGFYGGIRKLYNHQHISTWTTLANLT